MNPKQQVEVGFWSNLYKQLGHDGFMKQRETDYYDNIKPYGDLINLKGVGLEVGTGCYSQLEWCDGIVVSIDPLQEEFKRICQPYNDKVKTQTADGEGLHFKDSYFDWVVCFNVHDHTPNPQLMADEFFRVLKPKGKLYYEVHFDDALSPAHYALWREEIVNEYFKNRKQTFKTILRNDPGNQYKFYAIYEK